MGTKFINAENQNLNYDDLYYQSSDLREEYEFDITFDSNNEFEKKFSEKKYSNEQIENTLKKYIENLVIEIESVITKKFGQHNIITTYNRYTNNWNEVLCSVEVNGKLINVKLTNDYICDDINNTSSVYITLFSDGKGVFAECIERVNQEYEFIDSSYAYVPVNEYELCFKELDKEKFIERIVSEINALI